MVVYIAHHGNDAEGIYGGGPRAHKVSIGPTSDDEAQLLKALLTEYSRADDNVLVDIPTMIHQMREFHDDPLYSVMGCERT